MLDGIRIARFTASPDTFLMGSTATGLIPDTYTERPVVGEIVKVQIDGAASATGSILVFASGVVTEQVYKKLGGLNGDVTAYPRVGIVDNNGTAIDGRSGNMWALQEVNQKLYVNGEGIGSPGSVGLTVWYRNPR